MATLVSHPLALFAVFLVGLMLVVEIGTRLRRVAEVDEQRQSLIESARQGLTVLLSFLLGFALPMTLPYYEARRSLMVDEADAISTVDQRAQLLPDPYGPRIRQLLPQYVDARLDFGRHEEDAAVRAAAARAMLLQHEMWDEIVTLVRQHPELVIGTVLAQVSAAVDDLSNRADDRLAAYERRIPTIIWFVLSAIAVLNCFVIGFSMQRRMLLAMLVMPLTVAIVLSLLAELEDSGTGFIRIGQESMQRLRIELREELGH